MKNLFMPLKPSTCILHPKYGVGYLITGLTAEWENTPVRFNGLRVLLKASDILNKFAPAFEQLSEEEKQSLNAGKINSSIKVNVFNHTLIMTKRFYDFIGMGTHRRHIISPSFKGEYLTLNSMAVYLELKQLQHKNVPMKLLFEAMHKYGQIVSKEVSLLKLNPTNVAHANVHHCMTFIKLPGGKIQGHSDNYIRGKVLL